MKIVSMATAGPVEDQPWDIPVVAAPEEIDTTTAYGLRAALASAARGQATVVVDMTRTHACDTTGLHVLVRAHKRALAQGGELRLVISRPDVRQLFAITGLDRVIRHFASLDEALAQTCPESTPEDAATGGPMNAGPVPCRRPGRWSCNPRAGTR